MSDKGSGTKGNNGEFNFPSTAPSKSTKGARRKRTNANANNDGGAKIIVALLAGAGAAFLLALIMLMSRLEAEEINNGLLNNNVGGTPGVDDQIYLEEVAQGRASLGLKPVRSNNPKDRQRDRQNKLLQHMGDMKKVYDKKLAKWEKAFNLPEGNPLEVLVHKSEAQMGGIAKAMIGKGKMPPKEDLSKDFHDAIVSGNEKEERRKKKRLMKENERTDDQGGNTIGGLDNNNKVAVSDGEKPPHIYPLFPPMPPHVMAEELFGESIITNTLSHEKPTMAGVIAILQRFLRNLHQMLVDNKNAKTPDEVIEKYFGLVAKFLEPLEDTYRDRSIFPIREDESVFMSLGAYRDHLLGETLKQAFKTAKNPHKLFVGAVVQNCFGIGVQCRTGVEVKGKNKNGQPITEVSDRPPDVNGIEQFCDDPEYTKYCESGQIRALYVNETESNGPTTARYFASKLWGGETYFLQADAHLRFAPEWDRLYAEEVKLANGYPKAVLSAYPPGFSESDPPYQGGSKGTRLCTCVFSDSNVEHKILRINTGNQCRGEESAPSQIAYIAAGFFFARAEFLIDVPFDPYLPWCFMGEEIALSLRAWTHGWNIYAPRKNLIAHQYRPGRMGLPKFWENTGRVFGRPGPGFNTQLQTITIQRVKYMVGYNGVTKEWMESKGYDIMLTEFEHYGPGDIRTMKEFLEHSGIDLDTEQCNHIDWCNDCTLQ